MIWGRKLQRSITTGTFGFGVIAVAVGAVGGGAAILFTSMIEWVKKFSTIESPTDFLGGYYIPFIPAAGGLIVGFLIHYLAREAKGHGVPEVMLAVSMKGGRIPLRVAIVKALASSLTIGTGGSVGREGPIVQIGSSLASWFGRVFRLSSANVKLLVACGAAAGVSATFNAPIAGAIFAAEVIYREFNVPSFTGIVLSSVTAAMISRMVLGDNPAFEIPMDLTLVSPQEILLYVLLGLLCALAAVGFTRFLYLVEDGFEKIRKVPVPVKAMLGGLIVGIIGFWFPQVFGVGYSTVHEALYSKMTLGLLAGLVLLKILATSITIGSGGSGGVFAPSLFIGAMLGGAFGSVVHTWWPGWTGSPGAYAAVGMAAVFAGAGRAPMTAILILFEMTQGYGMILPLMTGVVVSGVAAQLMMKESIYTLKLKRRGLDIEAKRPHSVLDYVVAGQVMNKKFDVVGPDLPIEDLLKMFKKSKQFAFPVLDSQGKLLSIITFQEISQVIDLTEMGKVSDLPQSELITCYPDQTLAEVMRLVAGHDVSYVPVIDPNVPGRILGVLSRHDMMRAISKVTLDHANKIEGLGDARVDEALKIIPVDLEKTSRFVGHLVKDLRFPPDVLLTSIRRRGQLIIPRGETQLEAGDRLAIQLPKGRESVLQRYLAGEGEETIHGDALRSMSTIVDDRSELAGKLVKEIRFPDDVLLTAIHREKKLIIPKGTTRVLPGDRIQFHFPKEAKPVLQDFLARQVPKE